MSDLWTSYGAHAPYIWASVGLTLGALALERLALPAVRRPEASPPAGPSAAQPLAPNQEERS